MQQIEHNPYIIENEWDYYSKLLFLPAKCRDGAVVRVLASHRCGPGWFLDPALHVGLVCFWFLPLPRVFLRVHRFSSLIPILSENKGHRFDSFAVSPSLNKVDYYYYYYKWDKYFSLINFTGLFHGFHPKHHAVRNSDNFLWRFSQLLCSAMPSCVFFVTFCFFGVCFYWMIRLLVHLFIRS